MKNQFLKIVLLAVSVVLVFSNIKCDDNVQANDSLEKEGSEAVTTLNNNSEICQNSSTSSAAKKNYLDKIKTHLKEWGGVYAHVAFVLLALAAAYKMKNMNDAMALDHKKISELEVAISHSKDLNTSLNELHKNLLDNSVIVANPSKSDHEFLKHQIKYLKSFLPKTHKKNSKEPNHSVNSDETVVNEQAAPSGCV